jgi:hypothetical protein
MELESQAIWGGMYPPFYRLSNLINLAWPSLLQGCSEQVRVEWHCLSAPRIAVRCLILITHPCLGWFSAELEVECLFAALIKKFRSESECHFSVNKSDG